MIEVAYSLISIHSFCSKKMQFILKLFFTSFDSHFDTDTSQYSTRQARAGARAIDLGGPSVYRGGGGGGGGQSLKLSTKAAVFKRVS